MYNVCTQQRECFCFDHAVCWTVRICNASVYETRRVNDLPWILVAPKHFFLRKGKQIKKGFMDQTWSWRRAILTGTLVWLSIRLVMLCVWFRWRSRAMEFLNTSLQMSQATPCPFIFFIIRWWFMWVTKTLLLEKTSLHLSQVSRFPITPVELRTRCKRHRAGYYLNSIL